MTHGKCSKSTTRTSPASFVSLPGELRNYIYHLHFENTFESQDLKSDGFPRPVQALKPAIAILRASRLVSREAAPIFWVDYVPRCHWGFGARYNDDERMLGFVNAARKYTLTPVITYQRRNLNNTDISANLAWVVLESTFNPCNDKEAVDKLRGEWEAGHRKSGFVCYNVRPISSQGGELGMKYCYHAPGYSWVRIRGDLVKADWDRIFATANGSV